MYVYMFSLSSCSAVFDFFRGIKKPSIAKLGGKSLTKQEIAEICKREETDDNEVDEKSDAHRMQGLGFRKWVMYFKVHFLVIWLNYSHRLAVRMSGNVVEKESLKGIGQQVNFKQKLVHPMYSIQSIYRTSDVFAYGAVMFILVCFHSSLTLSHNICC